MQPRAWINSIGVVASWHEGRHIMSLIDEGREFLKSKDWLQWKDMQTD